MYDCMIVYVLVQISTFLCMYVRIMYMYVFVYVYARMCL